MLMLLLLSLLRLLPLLPFGSCLILIDSLASLGGVKDPVLARATAVRRHCLGCAMFLPVHVQGRIKRPRLFASVPLFLISLILHMYLLRGFRTVIFLKIFE